MKKKRIEYLILLSIFLLFLFADSLDLLFIKSDKVLNAPILNDISNKTMEEENSKLKEALNFKEKSNLEFFVSKVKYRDIYNFKEEITIFKGKHAGLKEGLAVIDSQGLIGVIIKVKNNSSLVRLITNKESNISVKINNTYGILKMQNNNLVVTNITNYDEVKN